MSTLLFSALTMRDLTLPNRIIVSPMCQYSAREGCANEWHLQHISQFAYSGVGMITDPHQAEEILQDGHADMIALARGFLYNPRWAWHAAHELGEPRPYMPVQYDRGHPDRMGEASIKSKSA